MRRARAAISLFAVLALATGCACGALSHEADAGSDAGSRDARLPADVPLDASDCWSRCSREGSRVTGTARIDGSDVPVTHALVSTSRWFSVYTIISLVAEDCDREWGRHVVALHFDPVEEPHLGMNAVRVYTSAGEAGTGSIDVSAWEPQSTATGPSGRLAARLRVDLPTVALDITVDVPLCRDSSSL